MERIGAGNRRVLEKSMEGNYAMNRKMIVFFTLLMTFFSLAQAKAEEEQKETKRKIQTRIYLQGSYLSNCSNPSSGTLDYNCFDPRSGAINPDLFELKFSEDAASNTIGFRLKLTAGEMAKRAHARGLGNANDSFDLMEACISYTAPWGSGLKLEAGKFNTFIGAEYFESLDNFNYSHSLLWCYGEPVTHTGMKIGYDLSKQVNLQGYVVNGWDNVSDNNGSPSLGLALGYTPNDALSMYINMLNGPEMDNNSNDNRLFLEWIGNLKLSKKFSLQASYDWAQQANAFPGVTAQWEGFSVAGKYDFTDRFYFSIRGEQFNDPQGYRTGTPQTLRELTFTPHFKVGENLYIRPEYRIDWSNVKSFNNGTSDMQSTIGIGVMLNF
jgi:hypothetical protein